MVRTRPLEAESMRTKQHVSTPNGWCHMDHRNRDMIHLDCKNSHKEGCIQVQYLSLIQLRCFEIPAPMRLRPQYQDK